MKKKYYISPKEKKMICKAANKVFKSLCKTNGYTVSSLDVIQAFLLVQSIGYGNVIEEEKIFELIDSVGETVEVA